jgi:hypothetical protein
MIPMESCPDCGAQFPSEGPDVRHAYLGASASCWRVYGEVLAKEYGDPSYMKFHRWTVDAYAAQHPGQPEPRTIQSINVHLLALYLLIEKAEEPARVTAAMGRLIEREKPKFQWLTPPARLGEITVADIAAAKTAEEHGRLVQAWAVDVWRVWKPHHALIRSLAAKA